MNKNYIHKDDLPNLLGQVIKLYNDIEDWDEFYMVTSYDEQKNLMNLFSVDNNKMYENFNFKYCLTENGFLRNWFML